MAERIEYYIDFTGAPVILGHLECRRGILRHESDHVAVQYRVYLRTVWEIFMPNLPTYEDSALFDRPAASKFLRLFNVALCKELDCHFGYATSSGIIYLNNRDDYEIVLETIRNVLTIMKLSS